VANHRLSGNDFKSCDTGFKNLKSVLEPVLGAGHVLINIPDTPAGTAISLSDLPGILDDLGPVKSAWAEYDEKKTVWNYVYLSALIDAVELAIANNEDFQFLTES